MTSSDPTEKVSFQYATPHKLNSFHMNTPPTTSHSHTTSPIGDDSFCDDEIPDEDCAASMDIYPHKFEAIPSWELHYLPLKSGQISDEYFFPTVDPSIELPDSVIRSIEEMHAQDLRPTIFGCLPPEQIAKYANPVDLKKLETISWLKYWLSRGFVVGKCTRRGRIVSRRLISNLTFTSLSVSRPSTTPLVSDDLIASSSPRQAHPSTHPEMLHPLAPSEESASPTSSTHLGGLLPVNGSANGEAVIYWRSAKHFTIGEILGVSTGVGKSRDFHRLWKRAQSDPKSIVSRKESNSQLNPDIEYEGCPCPSHCLTVHFLRRDLSLILKCQEDRDAVAYGICNLWNIPLDDSDPHGFYREPSSTRDLTSIDSNGTSNCNPPRFVVDEKTGLQKINWRWESESPLYNSKCHSGNFYKKKVGITQKSVKSLGVSGESRTNSKIAQRGPTLKKSTRIGGSVFTAWMHVRRKSVGARSSLTQKGRLEDGSDIASSPRESVTSDRLDFREKISDRVADVRLA